MRRVRVIGIDAAFANMGLVHAVVSVEQLRLGQRAEVSVMDMRLVETSPEPKRAQVRKSSDRLRRAQELLAALRGACDDWGPLALAFVEVPTGSQSAVSAFALGATLGVLAACPVPIVEVTPGEVKDAVEAGPVRKGASKADVVRWASARWPGAPWLRTKKGALLQKNEHLADALAAVVAGTTTPEFRRLAALLANHEASGNPHRGPAPRRALIG